jgi:hypothetical protein
MITSRSVRNWFPGAILLIALVLLSCAEKSLTTDPGDNPVDSVATPLITSISPNPAAIGAELTIDGENFGSDASAIKVYIGDVEAEVKSVTPTKIIVVVPVGVQAGKDAVKVVKDGKTAQSNDSLSLEPKPLPYREAWMVVSGINVESEHRKPDLINKGPDSVYVVQRKIYFSKHADCDSMARNDYAGIGAMKNWCNNLNHLDTVRFSCSGVQRCGYGCFIEDGLGYTAIVDSSRKEFKSVSIYIKYSNGGWNYSDGNTLFMVLQNISYTVDSNGSLVAELHGGEILEHLVEITGSSNYSHLPTYYTEEILQVVSVQPDAVVRVVLTQ